MSTNSTTQTALATGFPELTELGMQIELLRVGRGLSKQFLARQAGTSRQQLWRVMTGKSELTGSLRHRLAEALQVDQRLLSPTDRLLRPSGPLAAFESAADLPLPMAAQILPDNSRVATSRGTDDAAERVEAYLCDCDAIEQTLATLPQGPSGRRIKRALLNALEEVAAERGVRLCGEFFELRGRVINDEG